MEKTIAYKEDALRVLEAGLDALADTMKITLGPRGRNVVLGRSANAPLITNDGVTIAREVDPEDPFARMGAKLVREASSKTNDAAGDGTTTATLLMQAMVHEGLKNMAAGANPVLLRRGMKKGASAAVEEIRRLSRKLEGSEEIAHVAALSSGDEAVGKMIADIMSKLSTDGVITIEESKSSETSCHVTLGMQFNRGYVSPHMITDREKLRAVAENAYLLITDRRISANRDIVPVLEFFANSDRQLVIIADEFEGEALNTLCYNCVRGVLHVIGVRAPAYGDGRKECLKDLAALTGAAYVSQELGIELKDVDMS
ncbi:MAG: chaperonin GroEL, partial [Bacteroides sp.]|nr:chaperonin GroEL [Bacteroides sp.]